MKKSVYRYYDNGNVKKQVNMFPFTQNSTGYRNNSRGGH